MWRSSPVSGASTATSRSYQALVRFVFRETLSGESWMGMPDRSFSDRPLLQAVDDPDKRQEAVRNLQTIRAYTLAFFDKSLRGARNTMLDRMQTDATIKVEPFS
jgi:hypothetical protein